jgi:hypothetical protein
MQQKIIVVALNYKYYKYYNVLSLGQEPPMIDLMQEHLVPVRDVPKLLPLRSNGKPIHLSACYRWMEKGIHGTRLEAVRVGGTTYTSREALQRFANHLSNAPHEPQSASPRRTGGGYSSPPGRTKDAMADRAKNIFGPRRERTKSGADWTGAAATRAPISGAAPAHLPDHHAHA